MMKALCGLFLVLHLSSAAMAWSGSGPSAPTDPQHPGSKVYTYGSTEKELTCSGREVHVFVPTKVAPQQTFPVVVYGHGQALGLDNYRGTLEHLAKKGVIAIFPAYDNGFFDQDWTRMGRDYSNLASCAIKSLKGLAAKDAVVFSGHSKGAYVASVAAGLAEKESLETRAHAVVLFEAAGSDSDMLQAYNPAANLTVVFSDRDSTVARDISETIFKQAASRMKQFILFKSYPSLEADHFWPLTQGSIFGGGSESAFHYYGEWKWLVAAANDLVHGGASTDSYIYGPTAGDKGAGSLTDDIKRVGF